MTAKSIATKIVRVMEIVKRLEKDGQMNYGQKYRYITEEQITGTLHDAFVEVGLTIAPTAMETVYDGTYTASGGATMILTRIRVTYTITDPDSGEFICVQAFGEGADVGDKSYNKAMTAAFKYALRQTFMLSSGDDPDHEPSQPAESQPQPQPQPAAQSGPRDPNKPISPAQIGLINRLLPEKLGTDHSEWGELFRSTIGRVCRVSELRMGEACDIIDVLKSLPKFQPADTDDAEQGMLADDDYDPFAS